MKNLKKIILSFTLFLALSAQAEKVEVKISGLVCPLCFSKVEKKFKEHPAIEKVQVEMEKKSLLVEFKAGKTLTDQEVKNIIDQDSGYTVTNVNRIP